VDVGKINSLRGCVCLRRHEKRPETESKQRLREAKRDQEDEKENRCGEEPRVFGADQRRIRHDFRGSRSRDHSETEEELSAVPLLEIERRRCCCPAPREQEQYTPSVYIYIYINNIYSTFCFAYYYYYYLLMCVCVCVYRIPDKWL